MFFILIPKSQRYFFNIHTEIFLLNVLIFLSKISWQRVEHEANITWVYCFKIVSKSVPLTKRVVMNSFRRLGMHILCYKPLSSPTVPWVRYRTSWSNIFGCKCGCVRCCLLHARQYICISIATIKLYEYRAVLSVIRTEQPTVTAGSTSSWLQGWVLLYTM